MKNPLLDSGITLAAITSFLYCASTANYEGYLRQFMLDADVLDRNFQQVLYNGFLVSILPIFFSLFSITMIRLFYSHFLLPELNDFLRKTWRRKKSFLRLKNKWYGKRKDSKIELSEKKKTRVVLSYLLLFMAFIFSLMYFENEGKNNANEILNKIANNKIEDMAVISVKIDDKLQSLIYLGCGSRNCAGLDPTSKIVYYFPQNGHSYHLPSRQKNK